MAPLPNTPPAPKAGVLAGADAGAAPNPRVPAAALDAAPKAEVAALLLCWPKAGPLAGASNEIPVPAPKSGAELAAPNAGAADVIPKLGVDAAGAPKAGVEAGVAPKEPKPGAAEAGVDAGVAPNAGVALAPNAGCPVAPNAGAEEASAPKAGVEEGVPKAGVDAPNAGALLAPKAGFDEAPKAGVDAPKAGAAEAAGAPKAGADVGVPKAELLPKPKPVEATNAGVDAAPKAGFDVAPKPGVEAAVPNPMNIHTSNEHFTRLCRQVVAFLMRKVYQL